MIPVLDAMSVIILLLVLAIPISIVWLDFLMSKNASSPNNENN
jgi:hypothetical protein